MVHIRAEYRTDPAACCECNSTMKILSVIGTRPEAVKMAPVVSQLKKHPAIQAQVLVTAQHREMLDQVLDVFAIVPDYDLNVMRAGQSPADVLSGVVNGLQPVLQQFAPDWVLVQGDTTTVLAAALSAAYSGCRVGHVEAGLRTYDRRNPFPEELNRVLVDHASDILFAPTEVAAQALLREGIAQNRIHVTGNTVIDALQFMVRRLSPEHRPQVPPGKRLILVTAHRRENYGQPIRSICAALRLLAERPDVHIVYPVHPNPNIREPVHALLGDLDGVTLLQPQDYLSFVGLMSHAYLILTDSGGVQEEAPSLGTPVLVLRSTTERPEAVSAGTARLVGTDTASILAAATSLLDEPAAYAAMARAINPFGDGNAAERIVDILCRKI
jgi:UDP-N-acetylglucosamine 2-epimerase (non-hydrolysing)